MLCVYIHTHTHTHNGILNHKKKKLAICHNMDELEGMLNEISYTKANTI